MLKFELGDVTFNPNIDVDVFNNIRREPTGAQCFDVREPQELVNSGEFPDTVNIPR